MSRKFVVIKDFTDLEDSRHVYTGGDFYPREGVELDEVRADALASENNAQKEPLIVEVLVKEEQKQEGKKTNLQELKNDELKALLEKEGIEYTDKATKKELIELLGGE